MIKKRIKKNLGIVIHVLTNGEAISLEGRDISVERVDPYGHRAFVEGIEMQDNRIAFTFRASEQNKLGVWKFIVWENYGKDGQTVVDRERALQLVASTDLETPAGHEPGLDVDRVDLNVVDIEVGIKGDKGDDGKSLYELMVSEGRFSGTLQEFLDAQEQAMKQAGVEATEEVVEQTRQTVEKLVEDTENTTSHLVEQTVMTTTKAIADAEKATETALQNINKKEGEMEAAELQREKQETQRTNAEAGREVAETERVQKESRRDEQMTQLVNDAQTAINMAGEAQQATDDALREISSKESEILAAEEQRKENEEQRISTFNTFQSKIDSKQDTISDLETIREGAALGKTALQKHQDISGLATKEEVAGKQNIIADLDSIRSGAAKGATALQDYTESDPIYTADKPKLALKSEIPDISGKADKTTIVTETEGNASYAILPNVLTKLGTLASSVTLSLDTSKEESGVTNVYDIIFVTPADAPSITWPEGISWIGGSAPAIVGGKTYEVSIMDNLATYGEY